MHWFFSAFMFILKAHIDKDVRDENLRPSTLCSTLFE